MSITPNINYKLVFTLLAAIFQIILHGCATIPVHVPAGDMVKPAVSGPANNLLQDAKQEMQHRRYDKAEILTERALRLEPHSAEIWQLLGRIKAARNNHAEAIQFYQKSNSLAGKNLQLVKQNQKLIEEAKRLKK